MKKLLNIIALLLVVILYFGLYLETGDAMKALETFLIFLGIIKAHELIYEYLINPLVFEPIQKYLFNKFYGKQDKIKPPHS